MNNAMTHMVAALTSPPKPRAKPADVWQIPYMENGKLRQFRPRGLTKTLLRSLEAAGQSIAEQDLASSIHMRTCDVRDKLRNAHLHGIVRRTEFGWRWAAESHHG